MSSRLLDGKNRLLSKNYGFAPCTSRPRYGVAQVKAPACDACQLKQKPDLVEQRAAVLANVKDGFAAANA